LGRGVVWKLFLRAAGCWEESQGSLPSGGELVKKGANSLVHSIKPKTKVSGYEQKVPEDVDGGKIVSDRDVS